MDTRMMKHPLPKKLNTKGCCFLCLQIVDFKAEKKTAGTDTLPPTKEEISLKCVQRHLQIHSKKLSTTVKTPEQIDSDEEIVVDLCLSCGRVVSGLTKSYLSLEKAQMEVKYWLELIQQQISEATKQSELVQNYSKRMTSDPETLTQLVFVDNLRKEIGGSCLKMNEPFLNGHRMPTVKLFRLSPDQHPFISMKRRPEEEVEVKLEAEPSCSYTGSDSFPVIETVIKHSLEEYDAAAVGDFPTHDDNDDGSTPLPELTSSESKPLTRNVRAPNGNGKIWIKNSETGTFDCTLCNKQLTCPTTIRKHYSSIHLGKRYECDLCGGSYSSASNLQQHKKICNGVLKAKPTAKKFITFENGKHSCTICNKTFSHRKNAWNHYQSEHLQRFKCELCSNTFSDKHTLKKHKKICKGTASKGAKPGTFCVFNPNTKQFICVKCKKEFATHDAGWIHHKSVHLNQNKCQNCNAVFKNPRSLPQHLKTCGGYQKMQQQIEAYARNKFSCTTCGKKFQDEKYLKDHHAAVHLNLQRYKCQHCDKKFKFNSSLRAHKIRLHLKERQQANPITLKTELDSECEKINKQI